MNKHGKIDSFLLSSEDLGEPWEPRKCDYIGTYEAIQTGQELYYVRINPPLSEDFLRGKTGNGRLDHIFLGTINKDWKIDDAGKFGFMVDVYAPVFIPKQSHVDVENLVKAGTGKVYGGQEHSMNLDKPSSSDGSEPNE